MRVLLIRPPYTRLKSIGQSPYFPLDLVPAYPDVNNFPFWPDAHYVRDIGRKEFTERANAIAARLVKRNNSFAVKFKRNK